MKLAKFLNRLYLVLIFLILYSPVLVLVFFSFNASKSRAHWGGFSLCWYKTLFRDKTILHSASNTLALAVISAFLATILGVSACVGMINYGKKTAALIMNLTNIPMISPDIVSGVSLMMFFSFIRKFTGFLNPGIITLIIAHTTFCAPYSFLSVLPKLHQITPQTFEAACDLGCPPFKAFFKVILPEIMPGIISGLFMAFAMSIDDFVISYFTSGNIQTLPITIYSMTRKSVSPEINALSSIIFVIVLCSLVFVKQERKQR
ncbi:MAG: ABC transporter permease [Oscillospiraceae bacterium]|jgi:spermidine/putrescine transport system permease protein|nr:ABC transporter permease [Oscillospiraceae bacterium]